jgi:hypothetical protein
MLRYSKLSFYMNSYVDKLFGKRKRDDWFIIVGVIVRRDNERETVMKGNDGGRWCSNGMVLCLGRRQNGDAVEWWRE